MERGEHRILMGTTFLKDYYLFLLTLEDSLSVGISEANPYNVVLE